jgi:capsular exopolysaccharide synthesis family protein
MKDLITITDPRSPASEAYRTLRTNLSFYSLDEPIRTLVVTSPTPNDGKSVTVANLAITMAQSGRRTILVDCDLRRPSLHSLFGVENEAGMTTMILDENEPAPLLATGVENLWLLPSGPLPPNPADLLGSRQVDRVIESLLEQADLVLLDAPPVVGFTDAAVLGARVDGVLLVLRSGHTRRELAERAKAQLERANARIIGATLTDAPQEGALGEYYDK